jgi:hypothetical protein
LGLYGITDLIPAEAQAAGFEAQVDRELPSIRFEIHKEIVNA